MKKIFKIIFLSIIGAILLIFILAFIIPKLLPENPEIRIKENSYIPDANINAEQALQIVQDSLEYKEFDKKKRIADIYVMKAEYGSEIDRKYFRMLNKSFNITPEHDLYRINVESESSIKFSGGGYCSVSILKEFFVNPFNSEILAVFTLDMCG